MSEYENDSIVIIDRSGRRQFIRRGAALIAAGTAIAGSSKLYADDCDRNRGQAKNAQADGSDSDTGDGADPTGCGKQPEPKLSKIDRSISRDTVAKVKKIKA